MKVFAAGRVGCIVQSPSYHGIAPCPRKTNAPTKRCADAFDPGVGHHADPTVTSPPWAQQELLVGAAPEPLRQLPGDELWRRGAAVPLRP